MDVSRRSLLAIAALVAALPSEVLALSPPAAEFDDDARAVLAALGPAIIGGDVEGFHLPDAIQSLLGVIEPEKQSLIIRLPGVFNQLSRVMVPTGHAWLDLDVDAQRAALEDWASSSIELRRVVVQALRQLVLVATYTNPASFAELRYGGPWLGRIDLPVHPPRFGEA